MKTLKRKEKKIFDPLAVQAIVSRSQLEGGRSVYECTFLPYLVLVQYPFPERHYILFGAVLEKG